MAFFIKKKGDEVVIYEDEIVRGFASDWDQAEKLVQILMAMEASRAATVSLFS